MSFKPSMRRGLFNSNHGDPNYQKDVADKLKRDGKDPLKKWEGFMPEFLIEGEINKVTATGAQKKKRLKLFFKSMRNNAVTDDERKAWALLQHQSELPDIKKGFDIEMLKDFHGWLQGKGKKTHHDRTPWGRSPEILNLGGVSDYLDQFIKVRHKMLERLQILWLTGPKNLDDLWLIFKYLIHGDISDIYSDDFIYEFHLWEKGFKTEDYDLGPKKHNKNDSEFKKNFKQVGSIHPARFRDEDKQETHDINYNSKYSFGEASLKNNTIDKIEQLEKFEYNPKGKNYRGIAIKQDPDGNEITDEDMEDAENRDENNNQNSKKELRDLIKREEKEKMREEKQRRREEKENRRQEKENRRQLEEQRLKDYQDVSLDPNLPPVSIPPDLPNLEEGERRQGERGEEEIQRQSNELQESFNKQIQENANSTIQTLQKENARLAEKNREYTAVVARSKKVMTIMEKNKDEQLENLRIQAGKELEDRDKLIRKYENALIDKSKQLVNFSENMENQRLKELQQKFDEIDRLYKETLKAKENADRQLSRVDEKSPAHTELEKINNSLQTQLAQQNVSYIELQSEFDFLKQDVQRQIEDVRSEAEEAVIREITEVQREKDSEIENLRQQLESNQLKLTGSLNQAVQEGGQLQIQNENYERQVNEYGSELHDATVQINNLMTQIKEIGSEKSQILAAQEREFEKKLIEYQEANTMTSAQLSEVTQVYDDLNEDFILLQNQYDEVNRSLVLTQTEASNQLGELNQINNGLFVRADEINDRVREYEAIIESIPQKLEEARQSTQNEWREYLRDIGFPIDENGDLTVPAQDLPRLMGSIQEQPPEMLQLQGSPEAMRDIEEPPEVHQEEPPAPRAPNPNPQPAFEPEITEEFAPSAFEGGPGQNIAQPTEAEEEIIAKHYNNVNELINIGHFDSRSGSVHEAQRVQGYKNIAHKLFSDLALVVKNRTIANKLGIDSDIVTNRALENIKGIQLIKQGANENLEAQIDQIMSRKDIDDKTKASMIDSAREGIKSSVNTANTPIFKHFLKTVLQNLNSGNIEDKYKGMAQTDIRAQWKKSIEYILQHFPPALGPRKTKGIESEAKNLRK